MKTRYAAVLAILAVAACSAKYTIVPPAVDLASVGAVGLVVFEADDTKGDLDAAATQYFLEEITAAQRVPVVELGPAAQVLEDIGRTAFDREAALALGRKHGVDAVFVGEILVTKVKPQIDLAAPLSKTLFARTAFDITMKVRLVSSESGATLWTQSAAREGTVGAVGMDNGVPVFSVRDKSAAMAEALRDLAYRLTWDFRPTRRRL